mgnify:CR=1 FL=1
MPVTRRKKVAPQKIQSIVERYARELRARHIHFEGMYLFGSHAKGTSRTLSDIDIAVVVKRLPKKYFEEKALLWGATRNVDTRIEPILIEERDLHGDTPNPIAWEVYTTGIRIE